MGLFDAFKKRPSISNNNYIDSKALSDSITQDVVISMNSMGITNMPILKFLYDDRGLFDGFFQSHMDNPGFKMIESTYGLDTYLLLLGCHALGFGAYVTISQAIFQKSISDWSVYDVQKITTAISETDVYELALNTLGYPMDSVNKKCLDRIVEVASETYKNIVSKEQMSDENLKIYMKVLYNAGITLVMRD